MAAVACELWCYRARSGEQLATALSTAIPVLAAFFVQKSGQPQVPENLAEIFDDVFEVFDNYSSAAKHMFIEACVHAKLDPELIGILEATDAADRHQLQTLHPAGHLDTHQVVLNFQLDASMVLCKAP